MFHIIASDGSQAKKRRVTNVIKSACFECRRRKVACSINRPCNSCIRFKCVDRCVDSEEPTKAKRFKKSMDTVVGSLNNCLGVLDRLFPNVPVETLMNMSRKELTELTLKGTLPTTTGLSAQAEEDLTRSGHPGDASRNTSDARDEQMNVELDDMTKEYGWDEDVDINDTIADDVNDLNVSRPASYLGTLSIAAVINVIFKLGKSQFEIIKVTNSLQNDARKSNSILLSAAANNMTRAIVSVEIPSFSYAHGLKLIDAFFEYVHPTAPVIHEPTFRHVYSSRRRKRPSWLALQYIVMAWGTIVTSSIESKDDIAFFKAARYYLKDLGSGNLEYLQALILMSGHYLHYRNMPNTAMTLSGAAFRMACGLGLHREVPEQLSSQIPPIQREMRRRIWWILYKMDISGLFSLGRPPMFSAQGITIEIPQNVDESFGALVVGEATPLSPVIAGVQLCKIIEKIELLYLNTTYPNEEEVAYYDMELVSWYERSPTFVKDPTGTSSGIYAALSKEKWEYNNARMTLFRSFLLRAALLRKKTKEMHEKTGRVIEKCRELAGACISDIAKHWQKHKISCWSAVWYLFQATMVPLVSLFSEDRHDLLVRSYCQALVEESLLLFEQMKPWRHTAERSYNLVKVLYEASRTLETNDSFAPNDECMWDEVFWQTSNDDFLQQNELINAIFSGEEYDLYLKQNDFFHEDA